MTVSDGRADRHLHRGLRLVLDSEEFIDSTSMGLVHQNLANEITDFNPAALELLGLTRDEILGRDALDPRWAAVHEDGSPYLDEDHPAVATLRTGERIVDAVMGIDNPIRARRWISITTQPVFVDGQMTGVVAAFTDVSDRVQRQHLLTLTTEVNRLAVCAESDDDLLERVCELLVTHGGYSLAWVGMRGFEHGDDIDIITAAGQTDYLFEGMVSVSAETDEGGGPGGVAMRTGTVQVVNRLHEFPSFAPWRERAAAFGLESVLAIPFRGRRPAMLALYDRHLAAFDPITVDGLQEIVRQVAFGVEHQLAVGELRGALEGTLDALGALAELRGPGTEGHQARVGLLAQAIALELGLDHETARLIGQCGEVHDVGTTTVPVEILTRPGPLTDEEFDIVQRHSRAGSDLLTRASVPWPIAEVALQHHERLDGSGYPSGLRDDEIILPSRIIAVADVVEAIAHPRPYRPVLGLDAALAEVERDAGTKYDRDVVTACRAVFAAGFSFPH